MDALAGLNGGKAIPLLIRGDKTIELRCGATAFDVRNGQGRSQLFVVDTEETRVDGSGTFDLDHERFNVRSHRADVDPLAGQQRRLRTRRGGAEQPAFSVVRQDPASIQRYLRRPV